MAAKKTTKPRKPRATKYSAVLCERLPEMFKEGQAVAEVCRQLRIGRTTFYRWVDEYPEFKEAFEVGKFISEAWWMRVGRVGATNGRKVNPAVWIFNMKNRFGWADRREPEELDRETPEETAKLIHETLRQMEAIDDGDDGGDADDRALDAVEAPSGPTPAQAGNDAA